MPKPLVYFDNAATTRPADAAVSAAVDLCRENFGNPSSPHEMGIKAEAVLKRCQKAVCGALASEGDVVFTSGATESNNLAVFGPLKSPLNQRVITTRAEHPSVLECFNELARRGYDVVFAPVDESGRARPEELFGLITENTALVSLCHVNGETGAVNDIETIGPALKRLNGSLIFHVDAAQSFCKLPIAAQKCGIDLLSLSAHKFHGLKGCGALFVRKGLNLRPLLFGGKQQKGLRSGTENTPGIAAMTAALELFAGETAENLARVSAVRNHIANGLENFSGVHINSPGGGSPYILSVSFPGVPGEVMLHALEERGIYVSTGSACSSKKRKNPAQDAFGWPGEIRDSAIRLSFSVYNTADEAGYFLEEVKKALAALRGGKYENL